MKTMRHILLFAASLILLSACQDIQENVLTAKDLAIIPQPAELYLEAGSFSLNDRTLVFCNQNELVPVAEQLNEKIGDALGYKLKITEGSGKGLNLVQLEAANEALGDEGYKLKVTPRNIEIAANTAQGVFYGIQTLLQLLPPEVKSSSIQQGVSWEIACVEIEDKPRFPWRGLMLDVSRHFFTKEEVKAYIYQLA